MSASDVPDAVAKLAQRQSGLITLEQVESLTSARSLVATLLMSGEATTMVAGVIRIGRSQSIVEEPLAHWLAMAPDLTLEDRLAGPILAVASHRTAAHVLGLGVSEQDRWTFTVSPESRYENRQLNLVRAPLTTDEFTVVNGLPVTRPIRVITDLIDSDADISEISTAVAFISSDASLASRPELTASLEKYRTKFGFGQGVDMVNALIEADMGAF